MVDPDAVRRIADAIDEADGLLMGMFPRIGAVAPADLGGGAG